MTHFGLLVFGEDVEGQLEQYSEHLEVPEYIVKKLDEADWMEIRAYHKITKPMSKNKIVEKFGDGWNGNRWKIIKGRWVEVSTYNPKSKYDYYGLGGGWDKEIILKDGTGTNEALVGEVDWDKTLITYSIVIDGEWFEKGRMGWFAMSDDKYTDKQWKDIVKNKIKELPKDMLVQIFEGHI